MTEGQGWWWVSWYSHKSDRMGPGDGGGGYNHSAWHLINNPGPKHGKADETNLRTACGGQVWMESDRVPGPHLAIGPIDQHPLDSSPGVCRRCWRKWHSLSKEEQQRGHPEVL